MIEFHPSLEEGWGEALIHGKIEEGDFEKFGPVADDMIADQGALSGLVLNATEFTGWENLHALLNHLKFVKNHHRFIKRVALVGNRQWQEAAPKLVGVFVKAEIRFFAEEDSEAARRWAAHQGEES
jgi:hypothetical protein